MHTAERIVPKDSGFEFEVVIEDQKIYNSLTADQIAAELTQAGSSI
jgi:hypothetical protein